MNRIASVIAVMEERGVSAETILEVVKRLMDEPSVDAQAERRRAADRERKRNKAVEAAAESSAEFCGNDENLFPPRDNNQPPSNLTSFGDISGARKDFEKFWEAYPARTGANPKKPARDKFLLAVKQGHNPDSIIAGAKAYAASVAHADPKFTAQAVTWLNQCRWEDDHVAARPMPATGPPPKPQPQMSPQLRALRNIYDGNRQSDYDNGSVLDASPNPGDAGAFALRN